MVEAAYSKIIEGGKVVIQASLKVAPGGFSFGLGIGLGIVLAIGIGIGIYFLLKKKSSPIH